MKNKKSFKSGFTAIIGMPNVGKSTLLNTIVGQKIAIISDKPQTTRNKILAIYSTDEEQIIFTDTPGIHKPHNNLGEYMVHVANESMDDTDVLIFVVDASKKIQETEREIAKNISKTGLPCILVLNKVDLMKKEDLLPIIADYSSMHDFASIVPVSAKNNDGVDILLHDIEDYLEEGPEFYDSDMVTDQPEKEKITNIYATIYCEKASHKGIIIGKHGEMLKKIGTMARGDIEKMLDKKVYLELWVKVKSDWRNSDFLIKNFGFTNE